MSDFFASAHMAGGKLWGQPALLHSTDGIRRDLVLIRHTGKPFPRAFQCARTQHLGQPLSVCAARNASCAFPSFSDCSSFG